jgi:glycosyltransferase involved in cell wall biosynthesis
MRKKVLVRGPALSQSGYGEHARMILRALWQKQDLFEVYILPTGWGHTGWISDNSEFRSWMDSRMAASQKAFHEKQQFDISMQVSIPSEFEKLAPVNVGITAGIETTKVSPLWLKKCNEMDKVIVPSTFAKWGFENTTYQGQDQHGNPATLKLQVPIEVVPYPVRDDVEVLPEFPALGLTEDDFAYLMVGQWGPRKNMDNAIRWWLEENWEQDVVLVVKTSHRRNNIMDRDFTQNRLKALLNSVKLDKTKRKCSLKLLHGDMSEAEIKTLYHHPAIKCMVTATHGEGFGLPLFEFAQTGKLIVAPGWSAHLDFLTYTNEKGEQANGFLEVDYTVGQVQQEAVWDSVIQADSSWCFPEEASYKQRIRQARTKYKKWEPKTKAVAERIKANFDYGKNTTRVINSILGKPNTVPKPITGISFCIPTNGARVDKTELTIRSIKSQIGVPTEIILCGDVDNFRHIEGVTLVDRKEEAHSRKVALLRNKAAEKAKFDTIAWCDDDIILDKEWLKNTLEFSTTNGWNILGNVVHSPDGTRYWDRSTISPQHQLVSYDHPNYHAGLYQSSAFFLTRKEVWNAVKWDEQRLVYADREGGIPEDLQYSYDLHKHNYMFDFNQNSLVWHNDEAYTEFNNGHSSLTLKKSFLSEKMDMHFFLPASLEFKNCLNGFEDA